MYLAVFLAPCLQVTEEECKEMIAVIDEEGSLEISMEEFLNWQQGLSANDEEWPCQPPQPNTKACD